MAPHDPMETAREVRRLASQVSGVRVDFFATAEGLPEAVRRKLAAMGEGTRLPRGAYDPSTGTVWVNAAAVSPSELPLLLLHEATAHAGLRKVLGDGLDRVLDAVWEAHAAEPEMLRIVERYFPGAEWSGTARPDGGTVREARLSEAQRREAAEEFVARYADGRVNSQYRGVEPAWWTELKQRVRMLLARLGWARDVAMDDREIETLLARAHRALGSPEWAARREGGARFSLSGLPDGTLFVEVDTDQDIFEGVDMAEWPRIAREMIRRKFAGRSVGEPPDNAFVNGTTAKEYAYPADHRMDGEAKAAKMRAATELDNLMRAARPIEEAAADDGRHGDAREWKYYDVLFRVGGKFFDGRINIKQNAKGRLFYDITDIKRAAGSPLAQYGSASLSESASRKSASTDGQSGQPPTSPGMEPNLTPNSGTASGNAENSGENPGNSGEAASGVRMDVESYSRSDGDLAVSALKPYLFETEMADAESCLEYLKSRGFREFDLRDAEELMARASSELLSGEAEAARESLEASREANADPLADGGRRAEALVAGMVRARKTADEIRRELSKLGVSLPQERLEAAMARAREAGSPSARRAFLRENLPGDARLLPQPKRRGLVFPKPQGFQDQMPSRTSGKPQKRERVLSGIYIHDWRKSPQMANFRGGTATAGGRGRWCGPRRRRCSP